MKQRRHLIIIVILCYLGLISNCTSVNVIQTPEATHRSSVSGAGEVDQIDTTRLSAQTNTSDPGTGITSISKATEIPLLTNTLSFTPQDTIIPTATVAPTTTPTPVIKLSLPLTSNTLNSVNEQQTPWTEWVNHFLSVNTDCAPYSSDLSLAAFRSDKFRVYDPRTNELKWEYDMSIEPVGGGPIVFSPDSQIIAHGGSDQILHIWNAYTGELLHEIDFGIWIFDIKFSGNGQWVIVHGAEGGTVLEAVNVLSGQRVKFPVVAPVSDTAILTDDSRIIAFLYDKVENGEERILIWNSENNGIETLIPLNSDEWVYHEFDDGRKLYYGGKLYLSPDGNLVTLIVDGETESNLQLWNVSEQRWISVQDNVIANQESVRGFLFSPNSSYFAVFSTFLDGVSQVRIWNISGELVGEVTKEMGDPIGIQCPYQGEVSTHYESALTSIAFTPDDLYLATFGYDQDGAKNVILWSLP